MSTVTVRAATHKDTAIISEFNQKMAVETEGKTLPAETIDRGVRRLMERPEYGFYLIAEIENSTVGTCMVTTEWSDWRDGLFWWVQSVYVHSQHRRKGIYTHMYQKIQTLAENNPDVCGFRLYVEKDNLIAQKTYQALGMSETDYLLYETLC